MRYSWYFKQRTLCVFLILLLGLVFDPGVTFSDDTELYGVTGDAVQPNVVIIFDTSGSMNTAMFIDQYDGTVDHTTPMLSQGKTVVFAYSNGCVPVHHHVKYGTATDTVTFKFRNYSDPGDICSGVLGYTYVTSDTSGYFYFDRGAGAFITPVEYDSGNSDHIRIFLPYAEHSVDPIMTEYWTWYDTDYLNWLFYYSSEADRLALKAQHDEPDQRAVLTRHLAASEVVVDLVDANPDVRFGLMVFDSGYGGKMLADVPSNSQAILSNLESLHPIGSTRQANL
jgi:hypothetical protein